ncbi:MAG: secondary thiamine-phosphate synthase enzyme YjbQ [Gemmatimonadales bacterium]|nr:secondary thiamine-phosphate synthase enzyme YjbQ [Gemmatimonadales bacterium]
MTGVARKGIEMLELELQSSCRSDFLDITAMVQAELGGLGIVHGAVIVFNPHTTAAVTINEGADPDVVSDMTTALDKLIPWRDGYNHAEGNSAAHIKASFFGSSVTILVENSCLRLGTWQKIWFCDFDGPRSRKIWIQAVNQA